MNIMNTFTQICCLIPCPIGLVIFAIPPVLLVVRRRRAESYANQVAYEDMPVSDTDF